MPFRRSFRRRSSSRPNGRYSKPLRRYTRSYKRVSRSNRTKFSKNRGYTKYFKRTVRFNDFSVTGSTGSHPITYQFRLNDLPGYTEFTSLFDQYKLCAVKVSFIPNKNVNYISSSGDQFVYGVFHSIIDYDGSAPANENQFLEYENHKMTKANHTHTRYLKPRFLQSADATSFALPRRGWLATNTPQIPHNSISFMVTDQNAENTDTQYVVYMVYATYYISCKFVK